MAMAEYVSGFTTGFSEVVKQQIVKDLTGVKVINVYDGLIHYQYDGSDSLIKKAVYLTNTFFVMDVFKNAPLSFSKMVSATNRSKHKFLINNGTYRVRFSKENQFKKVDKNIMLLAEKHVGTCSRLRIDRVNPTTEIWYVIRSENVGFYCQLIHKREATEKNLSQGELRPEFAYLMCSCTKIKPNYIVCDPFCGYGAIPKQLVKNFNPKRILAFDIDRDKIKKLERSSVFQSKVVSLAVADALDLSGIASNSVDVIFTDPPWGYYEPIDKIEEFYIKMFIEFERILVHDGVAVILSARKKEFEEALNHVKMTLKKRMDTLVNGKKAAVYILKSTRRFSIAP